ncbi:c-type cytochrome [Ferrimonas lipolytica]|uniref:Cytochrome c n=1 Tax=Ferrimonas lipolytica TaxID=2724191 RepID=A0A6H1UDK9_9GAMM|nr:cytochrome c [Ferrimonas lipolytica]QIZ76709.1 cytochrome c [Ferrimonas lipolytica]
MKTDKTCWELIAPVLLLACVSGCSEQPKADRDQPTITATAQQQLDKVQSVATEVEQAAKTTMKTVEAELANGAAKVDELAQHVEANVTETVARVEDAAASPKLDGKALALSKGCIACHKATSDGLIGPGWGGLAGSERSFVDGTTAIADDAYLRAAITNPNAQIVEGFVPSMPAMPLTDAEVEALVEYINTLK